ncbi:MAG: hypothetical protein ACP5D7_11745 [Limnospira sp.]
MSQLSSNNSTSPPPELKPALQSILGSLDVKLEQELTRYRRYRRGSQKPGERSPISGSGTSKPTPEAIGMSPGTDPPKPEAPRPPGWESVVLPEAAPIVPRAQNGATSNGNGSHDTATVAEPAPDGYLESTEQLIDSIERRREYRRQRRDRTLAGRLLTPVGLLSMLLLFLSCAVLGYVVTSPAGMRVLGLDRIFKRETPEAEPVEAADVEPTSPNLATQEFVELDLNTLSNIDPDPDPPVTPPSPAPIPPDASTAAPAQTTPTPIPTGPGLNNLSDELLPEPAPPAPAPAPAPATPTPTPGGGSAAQPTGEPVRAEDGFYYVVTDYQDEAGLEAAREVVPDAYVREFETGVKIQFGALGDAASAKRLAEELRVQGISVQYDRPKD